MMWCVCRSDKAVDAASHHANQYRTDLVMFRYSIYLSHEQCPGQGSGGAVTNVTAAPATTKGPAGAWPERWIRDAGSF